MGYILDQVWIGFGDSFFFKPSHPHHFMNRYLDPEVSHYTANFWEHQLAMFFLTRVSALREFSTSSCLMAPTGGVSTSYSHQIFGASGAFW